MKRIILLLYAVSLFTILPCSSQSINQPDCLSYSDKSLIDAYWKIYTDDIPSTEKDYELAKIWLRINLFEAEEQDVLKPQLYFLLGISHLYTSNHIEASENFRRVQRIFEFEEIKPRIYHLAVACLNKKKKVINAPKPYSPLLSVEINENILLHGYNAPNIYVKDIKARYILIHFWATWCKPCMEELREFSAFFNGRETIPSRSLHIISVNNDFRKSSLKRITQDEQFAFPIYFDPYLKVNDALGIGEGLPQTIILDQKEMKIVRRWMGKQDWLNPQFREELQIFSD